ncbi:VOC family protein [Nocardioides humilatus]|uniref:VOC family protein n=1 Tax=Nocardioides humilatus TaxID=2607660 RepID=A0A5B1LD40_9ACTN|nr:VOC family protein [Nocardioides humilatus]KAA1418653.1 VOC family protein [Nocardioides humilatus]
MYLENIVFDAVDPQTFGRSWEATLGTETLTDQYEGYETRLAIPDGPVLDLCFQRVPEEPVEPERLHLEVRGPDLVAIRLAAADPDRDRAFWQWLTGWVATEDSQIRGLQHPSGNGPVLELVPEDQPKGAAKNRIHLDLRLEAGDDADEVARGIADHGGQELHFDWGDLPWRHFADPSGNEFCVLRAP